MPTGSGKTAVLLLTPFFLRASRVLIITPSILVRNQIFELASDLSILRKLRVIPDDFPNPLVKELTTTITSNADWEALKQFDLVVSTPKCCSPGLEGIPNPPKGIFDVVLIDEAHHSTARTWAKLLNDIGEAKKVLFTATPFRRDKEEISGKFIFVYTLKHAQRDGIFGKIRFIPIEVDLMGQIDEAIAKRTEEVYASDTKAGYSHKIMVRTDSKKRAEELYDVYRKNTSLRLQKIHSGHTKKHVDGVISKLRNDELDGIICVDMLGEGFDFPSLKIAAVHSPHKSLAVTLQFIGRFARTSGNLIGGASFIACPQEIGSEVDKLYQETAVWDKVVADLSLARTSGELEAKEIGASFEPLMHNYGEEDEAVDFRSFKPFSHVKIYEVERCRDFSYLPSSELPFKIVDVEISREHSSVAFLTREISFPEWDSGESFSSLEYNLFVIYFCAKSKLLFINSSKRTAGIFDLLGKFYSEGTHRVIPQFKVSKVLLDVEDSEFFNIGMKCRSIHSNSETYRIVAGRAPHQRISSTDGLLYNRAHVFGRGSENNERVTIGYSSGSKVWSIAYKKIGELIVWFRRLSEKISCSREVVTNTHLDFINDGKGVEEIPGKIIAAAWPEKVLKDSPSFVFSDGTSAPMVDFSLNIGKFQDRNSVRVITGKNDDVEIEFNLDDGKFWHEQLSSSETFLRVCRRNEYVPIEEFLNEYPLTFFLPDFSSFCGVNYFSSNGTLLQKYPEEEIEAFDWASFGVDIEDECGGKASQKGKKSIHDFIWNRLTTEPNDFALFDHRAQEIADFLTMREINGSVEINLFHCKPSGGRKPGKRIEDVYDVSGQVIKSTAWLMDMKRLFDRIGIRVEGGSQIMKGSLSDAKRLLFNSSGNPFKFIVTLVQPGISKEKLSEEITTNLLSALDYVKNSCGGFLRLIVSK